jgi:hypothetical protein
MWKRGRHWGKMGEGRKGENVDVHDGLVYICKFSSRLWGTNYEWKVEMSLTKRSQ